MRSIKCVKKIGNMMLTIKGIVSEEMYNSNKELIAYQVKYDGVYRICRIKEWDIELGGYIL